MAQEVDSRIIKKIEQLTRRGITNVREVKVHLEEFVDSEIVASLTQHPSKRDRRFRPTLMDIRNCIQRTLIKERYDKLDQVNLEKTINGWGEEKGSFFLRTSEGHSNNTVSSSYTDSDDDYVNNDGLEMTNGTETINKGFLYVHQNIHQKRLLNKYGNDMFLIDATYKTTKYALPLFQIAVKTNVNYQVVATFITENERKSSIKEALSIIQKWNPNWSPRIVMTDFCESEINACRETFHGELLVYLCDFHVHQAWDRWLRNSDHNVPKEIRTELKNKMLAIAHARRGPVGKEVEYVDEAITQLTTMDLWKSNEKLQNWFSKKWLANKMMWARAFRTNQCNVVINTNNGVEAQHRLLKYTYLKRQRGRSLSSMVKVMVEDYLPDMAENYDVQNLMYSGKRKVYSDDIPSFLHHRPRTFIQSCLEKMHDALNFYSDDVIREGQLTFMVRSERNTDNTYRVDFTEPLCECEYWELYLWPCKHMFAVWNLIPQTSWDSLPQFYRQNKYLTLDLPDGADIDTNPPTTATSLGSMGIRHKLLKSNPKANIVLEETSINTPNGTEVREMCKEIMDISYNCPANTMPWNKITERLRDILSDLNKAMRREEGLPLGNEYRK